MNNLVYSNSCSFGAPQEHPVYSDIIAKRLSCDNINEGVPGSCNRRIIRTSLRTLVNLKEQGFDNITALIGLTFIHRTELWQPHLVANDNDGDFHPIHNQKIQSLNWSYGQSVNLYSDIHKHADAEVKDYYKQWLIHFSKESAVTDLISDIIMLNGFAVANNINILFFCNCKKLPGLPEVDVNAPFLSSLKQYTDAQKSIIDLWGFSFADFARDLGHRPKDEDIYGIDGHPSEVAHLDFADFLLDKLVILN